MDIFEIDEWDKYTQEDPQLAEQREYDICVLTNVKVHAVSHHSLWLKPTEDEMIFGAAHTDPLKPNFIFELVIDDEYNCRWDWQQFLGKEVQNIIQEKRLAATTIGHGTLRLGDVFQKCNEILPSKKQLKQQPGRKQERYTASENNCQNFVKELARKLGADVEKIPRGTKNIGLNKAGIHNVVDWFHRTARKVGGDSDPHRKVGPGHAPLSEEELNEWL